MSLQDLAFSLSTLPIVNLDHIGVPMDGLNVPTSEYCKRHFSKSHLCKEHYENLAKNVDLSTRIVQCPFGLSSFVSKTRDFNVAFTGVIPWPREGGKKEKVLSKQLGNEYRVPKAAFYRLVTSLTDAMRYLMSWEKNELTKVREFEKTNLEKHSMALHEIRKLNRTVKQTAERLCRESNPHDPTSADVNLVSIWKSADLMSMQFEIVELLANETLTELPLKSEVEVYRIFDKCVRIYKSDEASRFINIRSERDYYPKIKACDKTFPIIPTVLIENALKYSIPDTTIDVDISRAGKTCVVTVNNISKRSDSLNSSVFERGVRAHDEVDGSGHGLHLLKLVTEQHGGACRVEVTNVGEKTMNCTFVVTLPEVPDGDNDNL